MIYLIIEDLVGIAEGSKRAYKRLSLAIKGLKIYIPLGPIAAVAASGLIAWLFTL